MYKLVVFHIGLNITSNNDLHVIQITIALPSYAATRWRYIHFRTKPKQIFSALTQHKREKSSLFTRIVILLDSTNVCFRPTYKLLRVLLMNCGIIDKSTKPAS